MLIIGGSKKHVLYICIHVKKYAEIIVTNGYLHNIINGYFWVVRECMFYFLAFFYFLV